MARKPPPEVIEAVAQAYQASEGDRAWDDISPEARGVMLKVTGLILAGAGLLPLEKRAALAAWLLSRRTEA